MLIMEQSEDDLQLKFLEALEIFQQKVQALNLLAFARSAIIDAILDWVNKTK